MKKYELALLYFPTSPTKKAATDNLTRAINRCAMLAKRLAQAPGGYNATAKTYTPRQVELIKLYLGEP